MDLGGGVASASFPTTSIAFARSLPTACTGLLTAQDSGGWRPHVTIQNKAPTRRRAGCSKVWNAISGRDS